MRIQTIHNSDASARPGVYQFPLNVVMSRAPARVMQLATEYDYIFEYSASWLDDSAIVC